MSSVKTKVYLHIACYSIYFIEGGLGKRFKTFNANFIIIKKRKHWHKIPNFVAILRIKYIHVFGRNNLKSDKVGFELQNKVIVISQLW